ncbi:MAG: hypothetical protein ABI658_29790, partial [Acidimicrobiales bacterium]
PDDATAVLKHLIALDPDGWGWNVNKRGTRWFVAPAHIDLLTVIEQVTGPGRAREVGFTTHDSELT